MEYSDDILARIQAALIEYATKQAEQVVERRLTEAEQKRAEQARMESFATRQREFAKATPDFEDRVLRDPTLPITAGCVTNLNTPGDAERHLT